MIKNYVTFMSPGTFVAESSTKEIDSWDTNEAVKMSKSIVERYGAKPYCFYFTTRERTDVDFDSKETKRSGLYYLGGKVKTIKELKAENNPKNKILISNMECNGWERVIETNNSYLWTQPLNSGDTVLEI